MRAVSRLILERGAREGMTDRRQHHQGPSRPFAFAGAQLSSNFNPLGGAPSVAWYWPARYRHDHGPLCPAERFASACGQTEPVGGRDVAAGDRGNAPCLALGAVAVDRCTRGAGMEGVVVFRGTGARSAPGLPGGGPPPPSSAGPGSLGFGSQPPLGLDRRFSRSTAVLL